MFERYYEPVFQKIISLITGIIFLGVPHSVGSIALMFDHFRTKGSKKFTDSETRSSSSTASILQRFDEAIIEKPIFSAYETRKSRRSRGLFRSKAQIVSPSSTDLRAEQG